MGDAICAYRSASSQGLPSDFYLWQGGKSCDPKKNTSSCSLPPPAAPLTQEEIKAFEEGKLRPILKRLPSSEKELEAFLFQANRSRQIRWVKADSREVYQTLQREINLSLPDQDVHLVIGMVHPGVEGQTEFINELLTVGKDKRKLKGVTHLALEIERINPELDDSQRGLDQYLVSGKGGIKLRPATKWAGTNIPSESDAEIEAKNNTFRIGYSQCYNLVMADTPYLQTKRLKTEAGEYSAREIFAVKSVAQRQDPAKKDVVVWAWGGTHTEKHRLPFYIKINDPKAKVVSVMLNGGTYVDAMAFDRVLSRLGWLEKTFIIKLDGYREADYIIHLPTRGKKQKWGISRAGDPVLQHIVNPH